MLLGDLLISIKKNYHKIPVDGISTDSKKVKKKDIFFAIKGKKKSGVNFIDEAISRGASAVISNVRPSRKNYSIPIILVKDTRKCLSEACSNFYKKKPNNIIAVTGTNGKTSVANFFYQILSQHKISVSSIGTLGIFSKNYKKKTNLTSIDPLSLHKSLEILARNKVKNLILEASSHGLHQKRINNLNIKIGIFLNFSQDHLDYHKSMKEYFNSKMYLFKNLLKKGSTILTDEDNKEFSILKKIANKKKLNIRSIGLNSKDIKILSCAYKKNKQIIKISIKSKIFNLEIPLIGFFQIKNLIIAALAASLSGLSFEKIFSKINKIKPVPGRLECVANLRNNSNIIIDFAHTPDALEQALIALKKQFKRKIIIVFGCGGDRDKGKRILMGRIASKYCRKIFITDDNPRNEDPKLIRNSIIKGCKKLAVNIGSRSEAIRRAINELEQNEILLVAGKGHEEFQNYGKKILPFSDKKLIKKIIHKNKILSKEKKYQETLLKRVFGNSYKNINYDGVSINSKRIKKNNLFFAMKGKNIDSHKFATEAINKGATRSVVSKRIKLLSKNKVIKVKNTFLSLNKLASATRNISEAKIIGITGSVGKTTLKNLISFSLKDYGRVYHSPHSYNNKFGVPLSVCNLKKDTEYGVFEVGMDKKGEIKNLSKIIRPEIAVITNIAEAHLKNFNSLKDIAKAKSEIIDNISKEGFLVLNKDDKFFKFLSNKAKKKKINILSFGVKNKSDIFLIGIKKNKNYFSLKISIKNEIFNFDTKYSNSSFVSNVLACISVLFILNLDLKKMDKKFTYFKIPEGRGDIKMINMFNKRFKFIDESYNANPLSMASAINNINYLKTGKRNKKFIFLGDMLELGEKSKKFHKDLSVIINKSNINKVFVFGKHIKETFNNLKANKKGKIFENIEDAYSFFGKILHNKDILMVKASNATGLNKFSKSVKKG